MYYFTASDQLLAVVYRWPFLRESFPDSFLLLKRGMVLLMIRIVVDYLGLLLHSGHIVFKFFTGESSREDQFLHDTPCSVVILRLIVTGRLNRASNGRFCGATILSG